MGRPAQLPDVPEVGVRVAVEVEVAKVVGVRVGVAVGEPGVEVRVGVGLGPFVVPVKWLIKDCPAGEPTPVARS